MKKVLPTLAEVYNILDQDDSQKGFSNVINPPAAFQVQVSENVNANIGQPEICYVTSGPNKGRPICSHCNRVGHIAERCYRKHGFPSGFTPKGKSSEKSKTQPVTAQVSASVPMNAYKTVSANLEGLIGNFSKDQIQNFIA